MSNNQLGIYCRALLEQDLDLLKLIDAHFDKKGIKIHSIFYCAKLRVRYGRVRRNYAQGWDYMLKISEDNERYISMPLIIAITLDNMDIVKYLINEKGHVSLLSDVYIDYYNHNKTFPYILRYACNIGRVKIVEYLLKRYEITSPELLVACILSSIVANRAKRICMKKLTSIIILLSLYLPFDTTKDLIMECQHERVVKNVKKSIRERQQVILRMCCAATPSLPNEIQKNILQFL